MGLRCVASAGDTWLVMMSVQGEGCCKDKGTRGSDGMIYILLMVIEVVQGGG